METTLKRTWNIENLEKVRGLIFIDPPFMDIFSNKVLYNIVNICLEKIFHLPSRKAT